MRWFNRFFWIFPFLFFFSGYYVASFLIKKNEVDVPIVVGLSLFDACFKISEQHLNIQIIECREDHDYPAETILEQIPSLNKKVKSGQTVYLIVSKKPYTETIPLCVGMSIDEIKEYMNIKKIPFTMHLFEHNYPQGKCFAQYPLPDNYSSSQSLHLFVSNLDHLLRILPSMKNKQLMQVIDFLKMYNISYVLNNCHVSQHCCPECLVIDQKPLPGTLVLLNKDLKIFLTYRCQQVQQPQTP